MRKMKDSGIDWIGKIPLSWDLDRIQYCLQEVKVQNTPVQTSQVLSLVKDKGVMLYEEKGDVGNKAKENVAEYKLAYPNTLIVNSMNILIGSVGISDYFGCVSPVYYVFKETEKVDLRFINYVFNTREFQKELRKYANGILEIRLRVSAGDIFKRKIPLPSKKEQNRISDFLDTKCAEIDALTTDIQMQIDTLEQYKRSVITEAVTKGLNPNVEMKDSGIERIGTIPKHWTVSKMKYFIDKISSGLSAITGDTSAEETGKYVLRTSAVSTGAFKPEEVKPVLSNAIDRLVCPVEQDTLIMSRMNTADMVGYCVYISDNYSNYYLPDKLWKIHTDGRILLAKYAWFLINAPVSHDWFARIATGASLSMLNISLSDFLNLIIAVPSVDEQNLIADYLDKKCSEIDAIIAQKKEQLDVLADYKKSLIYEYVTGKKEVQQAASDKATALDPQVILMGILINKLGNDIRGKVQIQKMLYLTNEYIGLNRGVQYYRYAHGPYDLQLEQYVDVLVSNHWYEEKHQGADLLVAGKNHADFVEKYGDQFIDKQAEINKLIAFLRPMKTSQVERIATLFAAWNDFIIDGNPTPTDNQIIHEVINNWTDNKANTQYATWQGTLKKMKQHGIVPQGLGLHTLPRI